MTGNDHIRFTVFHTVPGSRIADLDVTINHAGILVSDAKLLSIFMDLTRRLIRDGYDFEIREEGDDQ